MRIDELVSKAVSIVNNVADFRRLLEEFRNELEFEYRLRDRRKVVVQDLDRAMFFGDIHGDLMTLHSLLNYIKADDLLKDGWTLVFLGDYVDRGVMQVETMAFIALLKLEWRSRVILLRGNHEPPEWLPPYPHDYPQELVYRYGFDEGRKLYELSREIFELLPMMMVVPSKVLAVHGGPPLSRVKRYDSWEDIIRIEDDREAIEEILWSDPIDEDVEWMYSYRGAGKLWGRPLTELTLRKLGVEMIVRGHEPALDGYKLNHGGRVLTLFTMKGYYGNRGAACLKIDFSSTEWFREVEKNIVVI